VIVWADFWKRRQRLEQATTVSSTVCRETEDTLNRTATRLSSPSRAAVAVIKCQGTECAPIPARATSVWDFWIPCINSVREVFNTRELPDREMLSFFYAKHFSTVEINHVSKCMRAEKHCSSAVGRKLFPKASLRLKIQTSKSLTFKGSANCESAL